VSRKAAILTADQIAWGGPKGASAHPFALTEAGAAESFAAAAAGRLVHDHRRGRWLIWGGHRWAPDTTGGVIRLALEHVRRQQHRALDLSDSFERQKAVDHWLKFDRRGALDNLLSLAKNLPPLADDGAGFDLHPGLLGCDNGVLELQTGLLRPGRPEDKITLSTGISFDPDAPSPGWCRFISQVLTDPEVADFVWRALGYAVTGEMREQVFFLLFGRGANGKSTLLDIIVRVLGDYALVVPFATFESERPGAIPVNVASMDGKRFVPASEGAGRWLHSSRLKDITGGEQVSARHLYGNPFTFRPVCKIFLSTNELPKVADESDGLWRRLRQVPFRQHFEGASDDRHLKDVLLAEAPGILAWLVRGCLAWQSRGLAAPAAVVEATAQYRADSDELGRFLDEACELVPGSEVRASELYAHYKEWASKAGFTDRERLSVTAFGRKAADRFTRTKTRTGWVYQGVARAQV
jgi:putative DNA primase/helicase